MEGGMKMERIRPEVVGRLVGGAGEVTAED